MDEMRDYNIYKNMNLRENLRDLMKLGLVLTVLGLPAYCSERNSKKEHERNIQEEVSSNRHYIIGPESASSSICAVRESNPRH